MSLTVRLSERAVKQLKDLASKHNMSQADVLESLLQEAASREVPENRKKKAGSS